MSSKTEEFVLKLITQNVVASVIDNLHHGLSCFNGHDKPAPLFVSEEFFSFP